jgi:hypothetical protein
MQIRIVNYALSASPIIQAFVDVELDGWLRRGEFGVMRAHRKGSLDDGLFIAEDKLPAAIVVGETIIRRSRPPRGVSPPCAPW